MPNWATLAAFAVELRGLEIDLTGPNKKAVTRAMGVEGEHIAAAHAARSLGADRAFSGWNRGHPIPLGTRLRPARDFNTLLVPTFPGGWTVADRGRNNGNASGFQGPGVNIRTGATARTKAGAVRKVRARRGRRSNGTTVGKHTARDAATEMQRRLPPIADKAVLKISRKRFDVT